MNILVRPIITEKATHLSESKHKYTFLVNAGANKIQIKSAVEVNYGVKVMKVSTIICGSKLKKRYTKNGIQNSKSNSSKKAIVSVAEGDRIDFYDNL